MSRATDLRRDPNLVPGTNFEYIETQAYRRMKRTAVLVADVAISYGRLCHDVMAFACALHLRGVRPGKRLAVNALDSYVHWVTLLAAEALGAVTCSLHPTEQPNSLQSISKHADFWIGESPSLPLADQSVLIELNQNWLTAAFAAPVDQAFFDQIFCPIALDAPQRLRRSSGTTGGMKLMVANRGVEESRMRAYADFMGLTPDSRVLVSKSFIVSSAYLTANLCMRLGAMVVFDSGESKLEQIRNQKITHVRLFQDQLLKILEEIDKTQAPKPRNLTVVMGGSSVTQALWTQTLEKFATRLESTYSTNECGSIGFMGPEGEGTVRAGVVLQVVDEEGSVLPLGQAGRIRVRTPSQMSGYLDQPEMSGKNFRDGWFYTGDMGIQHSARRIELLGRIDDVLNIAGYKHSSPLVEEIVLQVPGVKDVCATSVRDSKGIDRLALVMVLKEGVSQRTIGTKVMACFPESMKHNIRFFITRQLLRTDSGKLRRKEISQLLKLD